MEEASRAVEERRYQDAIDIYLSLLENEPDNAAIRARLARTYYLAANQNPEYFYKAAGEYNTLINKMPDFSLPYLELGQIAYLLALRMEAEERHQHALTLYQSSIDWFEKYINLEKKKQTPEKERETAVTRVLQAVVYIRTGEKEKAREMLKEAEKEYQILSVQQKDLPTLYDYFARSGVEYLTASLYNQALIYLEGAWLIEPRPQVKSLLESIIKNINIKIPLIQPLREPEISEQEKETLPQKALEEQIKSIQLKIENLTSQIETLASLEEKVDSLKKKLQEVIDRREREGEKVEEKETLPQENVKVQEIETLQKTLSDVTGRVKVIEEKIKELEDKVTKIKSVADMFGILNIQLQEIRKTLDELEKKIESLSGKNKE
ncbi:hypothetical protein H5U35_03520 [Candidatus Aerophobetes bacterium]|nr:hypothetical protein [Candidatus Aerophobetes bacterium]